MLLCSRKCSKLKPKTRQITTILFPSLKTVRANISVSDTGAKVELYTAGHTSWTCLEWYIFATQESIYLHPLYFEGFHSFEISEWKKGEHDDVMKNGMQVFLVVEGLLDTIINLAETWLELFSCLGDQSENNRLFLQEKMNITFKERKQPVVTLNKSDIKSGMYLGVTRFDGLDPMIMWGTGGHTGHTAMTMWMDGELYVMESTSDPWPLTCSYWPQPENVMKTQWDKWISDAIAAEYMVSIFPLSPENQKKFNETAALEFFKSVEGHPYGFSNFIFGWIDGAHNYPPPLSNQLIATVFALVDRLYPTGANIIYLDGLNLRLEQWGLPACGDMECVIAILDAKNLSFDDLMAIPEQDNWNYPDGKNMVCDVFVLSMYKAGGLFGSLASQIQATEQTPRDSYMMKLYDANWKRPTACQVDDLPWCQLLGKYLQELPYWNTVELYANMNEKCNSEPTKYERCPGLAPDNPRCKC
jgi:hypothetical protein